jgi:hypothetical protein
MLWTAVSNKAGCLVTPPAKNSEPSVFVKGQKSGQKPCPENIDATVDFLESHVPQPLPWSIESTDLPILDVTELPHLEEPGRKGEDWKVIALQRLWWPGAGSNRRPSDFQSDARTN